MKRRLSETTEVKADPGDNPLDAISASNDLQHTVATLVAQQVAAALLNPLSGGSAARFGRVAFAQQEQESVNAFLHQKLGKESLTRRPGPGGRKLTYIESCKAIELANRAFGFNGWSCRIVECKEEYKEKKGDRWSVAYSSLVRIELKDGTSHEDVGFGTSDGQRDLGAALEQAKKASISDARKRALRLFGEYLGNSCYDKDHIKGVNSNKPMAPLAAAPDVLLPGLQQQSIQGGQAAERPSAVYGGQPQPQLQPQAQQQQQAQPPQQQMPPQQAMPQLQVQPPQQRQAMQQRPQMPQQAIHHQQQQQQQQQRQQQQQHWKPPQVMKNPLPTNGNSSVQQQQAKTNPAVSTAVSTTVASNTMSTVHRATTLVTTATSSSSPFRPQPQHWVSSNAPPPPRMMASNYPSTIVKTDYPAAAKAAPNAQYNMEDLSLSQFDYDPDAEFNPAKKMRS